MASTARTEKLDLRLSPDGKLRIVAAANAPQRSVREFVLFAALNEANDTLPDRRYFGLDAERWEAFREALDAPARDLPRLRELLSEPGVFEREESE